MKILYSGMCDYCKYTWEDEEKSYKCCPKCGLTSDVIQWGRSVKPDRYPWGSGGNVSTERR